jgi:hypothetical protein
MLVGVLGASVGALLGASTGAQVGGTFDLQRASGSDEILRQVTLQPGKTFVVTEVTESRRTSVAPDSERRWQDQSGRSPGRSLAKLRTQARRHGAARRRDQTHREPGRTGARAWFVRCWRRACHRRGKECVMPQQSWSAKRERQYQEIKKSLREQGRPEGLAEEIAARTVNKERARSGESRQASRTSTRDISSSQRGGQRSHTGSGGRTKEQLYQEAKRKNVKGRSSMSKAQLERAVGR